MLPQVTTMSLFDGPTEMHARCRAYDWASTSLGAPECWPMELRTTVRLMLGSAIPACLLWGPEYVQIYNDAMARVFAGKHPAALGQPSRTSWPEGWAQNEPMFARVMTGETVFVENAPYESHRHGRVESMHITASFSPVHLADGAIGGVFSNLVETTDVVALRRLEAERLELIAHLEQEKSRLTSVFQHAPTFLAIMMGPTYVFTEVNDAYYQLVGHRESIGRPLAEVVPEAVEQGFIGLLDEVMRTGEPFIARDIPFLVQRSPGAAPQMRYLDQVYLPYIEADGTRTGVVAHGHDVTSQVEARQQVERLLAQSNAQRDELAQERANSSAVLESMRDNYFTLDAQFRFTTINRTMRETLHGMLRDAIGRPSWELFPDALGTPVEQYCRRVMTERVDVHFTHHYLGDGIDRHVEADVYPTQDGGIAVFWRDITEQMRARREVERARETADAARMEAEAANKAKGEFLAVMSHELRTPLNAIGGYAELIELGVHGAVTDAQRTALSRIQASQRHLLGLINGVLNYSRVEAGAVTYDVTTVPLHEALAEAESLVAPQIRAKGLRFVSQECTDTLMVRADREKLQQILLNLLSNAIKFTDARAGEQGTVEVTCHASGDRVLVHVRDTGEGIDPDKLRSVFEPFVQIDQRLTRRQQGVGLGLTISRDLARGMGGDLTAASVPGEGSTFTLSLPRVGAE